MGMQNIFPDKIDLWVPPALLSSQNAEGPPVGGRIFFPPKNGLLDIKLLALMLLSHM